MPTAFWVQNWITGTSTGVGVALELSMQGRVKVNGNVGGKILLNTEPARRYNSSYESLVVCDRPFGRKLVRGSSSVRHGQSVL